MTYLPSSLKSTSSILCVLYSFTTSGYLKFLYPSKVLPPADSPIVIGPFEARREIVENPAQRVRVGAGQLVGDRYVVGLDEDTFLVFSLGRIWSSIDIKAL